MSSMPSINSILSQSGVAFGTSGARGLVTNFTDQVCAAFTQSFISVMQKTYSFKRIAIGIDNRPSSPQMAAACVSAIKSMGYAVDYYGVLPTPALAYQSMQDKVPAIMVTGSHIPFDRNGLKFYRPDGEISKADESAILAVDAALVEIKQCGLPPISFIAAEAYLARYRCLFSTDILGGKRIGIYEHSSAGRDLYATLFESLGAEVVSFGRSDEFVPIDTEAVGEADKVKARRWSAEYQLDAIFSTDGDGDRPLVADEHGEWLRGDILGLLCADALDIEALAIPVSCNTAVVSCGCFEKVALTRIGSPYVIAEFAELAKNYQRIAGFEANGGFLLGSDIEVNDQRLVALPTRDAVLPFLMLLASAGHDPISSLVSALPQRFTHSDRITNFPVEFSRTLISEGENNLGSLLNKLGLYDKCVAQADCTDGLRLFLTDGCIIHLRPSGNAPELRCYAEANTYDEAKKLVDVSLERISSLIV